MSGRIRAALDALVHTRRADLDAAARLETLEAEAGASYGVGDREEKMTTAEREALSERIRRARIEEMAAHDRWIEAAVRVSIAAGAEG